MALNRMKPTWISSSKRKVHGKNRTPVRIRISLSLNSSEKKLPTLHHIHSSNLKGTSPNFFPFILACNKKTLKSITQSIIRTLNVIDMNQNFAVFSDLSSLTPEIRIRKSLTSSIMSNVYSQKTILYSNPAIGTE